MPDVTVTLDSELWETVSSAAEGGMLQLDPEYQRPLYGALDVIEAALAKAKANDDATVVRCTCDWEDPHLPDDQRVVRIADLACPVHADECPHCHEGIRGEDELRCDVCGGDAG